MSLDFNGWSPGGIRNYAGIDAADGAIIMARMQDCSPFLERAAQIRNHGNWRGDNNDFWHVASVPNVILEEWLRKGIRYWAAEDWPKIKQLLNGEYKWLKTAPVTI